jgi:hypothetical protein
MDRACQRRVARPDGTGRVMAVAGSIQDWLLLLRPPRITGFFRNQASLRVSCMIRGRFNIDFDA